MAIYFARDIQVDDSGELTFENGDLAVATVRRSHLQALHWLVASNRGDTMNGDAVADLGGWIGRLNNSRTHRMMEDQIHRAIGEQQLFGPGDVLVAVIPVDLNDAAVTSRLRGNFIEPDPDDQDAGYSVLAYQFPFSTGALERIA